MFQKFKTIDNFIITLIALVSSWIILGAIPKLHMTGMYRQVETQILFIHLIGGVLFLYQSIKLYFIEDEKKKLSNIIFLMPFLIGALSLIFSFFTEFVYVSLLGSPQVGQGAFWYFDLSIMVLVFSATLKFKKIRKIILINCLLMTAVTTLFTIYPYWKGLPVSFFYFNDYLCYFGVLIFILFTTVTNKQLYLIVSFVVLGFYLSILDNKAAQALWVITLLIAIVYFLLKWFNRIKIFNLLRSWLYSDIFFTSSVIMLSLIIILSSIIYWPGSGQISNEIASSPIASLVVRGKIAEVALSNLISLKNLFFGFGWGNVPDLLVSKMNIWQFDQLTVGYNLHFHTHNELYEHFISLGLAGLVLFLFYIYFIFKCSEEYSIYTKLGWLLFFYISCFWFFWAGTLPLIALALASLNYSKLNSINYISLLSKKIEKVPGYYYSAIFVFISFFLFFGAWLTFYNSKMYKIISYSQLLDFSKNQDINDIQCEEVYYDDKRGGYTVAPFLYNFSKYVVRNSILQDTNNLKVIKFVQCLAHKKIFADKASLQLLSSSILTDSTLYFAAEESKKKDLLSEANFKIMKKKAEIMIKKAPKRGDLIIPFIAIALETGKVKQISEFCLNDEIKGIENICFFIQAYEILQSKEVDRLKIKKSLDLLEKAVETGILQEKVYGWWLDRRLQSPIDNGGLGWVKGYGLEGVPLSPDIIFLISQKEAENISNILSKR